MARLSQVHVNRPLTNFSLQYRNAAFAAEALFPRLKVENESDSYFIYGAEAFHLYKTKRADGAEATEIDWSVAASGLYKCEDHALRGLVTDRERANADKPLTLDLDTTQILQDALDLDREYATAALVTNTANYPAGNTQTNSGTSLWSNANSTPLQDIRAAKSAIYTATLKRPNVIVIPTTVGLTLSTHPTLIDIRKYTDPRLLSDMGLPPALEGLEVVEAGAGYQAGDLNAATSGPANAVANLAQVWGDNVIVAYVEKRPKIKSVTFGMTFWTEKAVKKWRVEERDGDMIQTHDIYDPRSVAMSCGYLIKNAA